MSQDQRHLLLVLGGTFHDFDGYATALTPLFTRAGFAVESTYDLDRLLALAPGKDADEANPAESASEEDRTSGAADASETPAEPDVVLLYTCLPGIDNDERNHDEISPKQAAALGRWVRSGGGLLASHCATVMHESNRTLRRLLGGSFVSHSPQFSFTVTPMSRSHPITAGIEAFSVHDELYSQGYDSGLDIHMGAVDRGSIYPMVWSKDEGTGRVAHVAPGHGPDTWFNPAYRQLMVQTLNWLCQRNEE